MAQDAPPSHYWWTLEINVSSGMTWEALRIDGAVRFYVGQTVADAESWAWINQIVRDAYLANYTFSQRGEPKPPVMLGTLSCFRVRVTTNTVIIH
ncbi:hypothetical protein FA95DRAFT_1561104, partial [Auriscalpium vulgare]